jgi:hypothetical protein
MAACNAWTFFGPCPFPADRPATAMCVHEHLRTGELCKDHLELLDGADCRECWEGTDPHRCPLTFADLKSAEVT